MAQDRCSWRKLVVTCSAAEQWWWFWDIFDHFGWMLLFKNTRKFFIIAEALLVPPTFVKPLICISLVSLDTFTKLPCICSNINYKVLTNQNQERKFQKHDCLIACIGPFLTTHMFQKLSKDVKYLCAGFYFILFCFIYFFQSYANKNTNSCANNIMIIIK